MNLMVDVPHYFAPNTVERDQLQFSDSNLSDIHIKNKENLFTRGGRCGSQWSYDTTMGQNNVGAKMIIMCYLVISRGIYIDR